MSSQAPISAARWAPLAPEAVADVLAPVSARWWLSGGVALDRWLGASIRSRPHTDISTTSAEVTNVIEGLPSSLSAWVPGEAEGFVVPWGDRAEDADIQPVLIRDDATESWVLRVNAEDGSDRAWIYRRDPRLQVPWDVAVIDVEGVPTGAPEIQLIWKALRPRPEDDIDKDAILPRLSEEARAWWEKALLSIHPHSSWAIHLRSPLFPAKPSWNRDR